MAKRFFDSIDQFKSPLRVAIYAVLRSRATQRQRAQELSAENVCLRSTIQDLERDALMSAETIRDQERTIVELKCDLQQANQTPFTLPLDPHLPRHQFGPRTIAMCVNLARVVGFRATPKCLETVYKSLGIAGQIPCWSAIRIWMMRAGVATIEGTVERADDWIWIIDHSNQIGAEKVLVVLGVRASKLPPVGKALCHEDMQTLLVLPGTTWKTENVAKALDDLANKIGAPLQVVSDGASELQTGAEVLKNRRPEMLITSDLKHLVANLMKKVVGKSPEFIELTGKAGSTKSEIQQTEMGHLTPPSPRPKSRFMNLGAIITWTQMIVWLLLNRTSSDQDGVTTERLENKLGWVLAFRESIAKWSNCQAVVSAALTFINTHGLSPGIADILDTQLTALKKCKNSTYIAQCLVQYVRDAAAQLKEGQRLIMTSEILESMFGQFKQLEKQHAKGGLTSLLAAFAATTKHWTPEMIREHFGRVTIKQTRSWVKTNLKKTVTSKRQATYRAFKKSSLAVTT